MTVNEFGQGEGTLSRAGVLVADARTEFDQIAGRLGSQISAVQGQWGGQGASAFFVLHRAWTEKQRVVVQALDEFAASLEVTEHDNVATDAEQRVTFSRLQARIGS